MIRRYCSRSIAARGLLARLLHAESQAQPQPRTASFGFREVPEQEKEKLVGNVFTSVASNYDLMNDIMSAGLHRLWKDRLVSKLRPFPGMQHLDVAGGTGDVAFRVLDTIYTHEETNTFKGSSDLEADDDTRVHICDINPAMLEVGQRRAEEKGLDKAKSIVWVEGDAEAMNFKDNSFDGYTIAFGIRNVTHIDKVLREAYRVLRRGGHFLCLELSHVENPIFKHFYDFYSFSVIPSIGDLVASDRKSYQYLVESIRKFPRQESFAVMIQEAGFQNVDYENLVGGVVAIHSGYKL